MEVSKLVYYEVREITDKEIWEGFVLNVPERSFLNSWYWGEFNKAMGNKIWRLGVFDDEKLVAIALVSRIKAKRGVFLLLQHAPCIIDSTEKSKFDITKNLLEELIKLGKKEKAIFIRMNPLWERNEGNQKIATRLGLKKAPMHANAYESTWKLDISELEEKILNAMRKTTRYLIRQTMKNQDIIVEKSKDLNDIEKYQELNRKVAQKQKFVPFSSRFIENEFKVFSKDDRVVIFFGKYKNEIVSAAMIVFWSNIAFYHQAASTSKHSKLSIPYLVMWEAIKEAKNRNCVLYDFWGYTDPKEQKNHPWAGPTLFKMGFGGYKKEYLQTQDLPLNNKYYLTYVIEKLRSIYRFSY